MRVLLARETSQRGCTYPRSTEEKLMTKYITHFCLIVFFGLLVCGVSYSEPLYDIVEVDLSRPVDIGPTVLQPGHYRFEQVNGRTDPSIFKVTGDQGEIATLTSVGFDAYKQARRRTRSSY